MKNPKKGKDVSLDRVLDITSNMSPDDLEVGELGDLQTLIEKKDDVSPDDVSGFIRGRNGRPNEK